MKEQLEQLIAELEESKKIRTFSNSHTGDCAELGKESGIDHAIFKIRLLILAID